MNTASEYDRCLWALEAEALRPVPPPPTPHPPVMDLARVLDVLAERDGLGGDEARQP